MKKTFKTQKQLTKEQEAKLFMIKIQENLLEKNLITENQFSDVCKLINNNDF